MSVPKKIAQMKHHWIGTLLLLVGGVVQPLGSCATEVMSSSASIGTAPKSAEAVPVAQKPTAERTPAATQTAPPVNPGGSPNGTAPPPPALPSTTVPPKVEQRPTTVGTVAAPTTATAGPPTTESGSAATAAAPVSEKSVTTRAGGTATPSPEQSVTTGISATATPTPEKAVTTAITTTPSTATSTTTTVAPSAPVAPASPTPSDVLTIETAPKAPLATGDSAQDRHEEDLLATAATTRPSIRNLALVERAAAANPMMWPRLAAMLLGRNSPGDASKAGRLLEEFARQRPSEMRGSIRLLLVLAHEREMHVLSRHEGGTRTTAPNAAPEANDLENEIIALHQELEAACEERDTARHEVAELRRKLRDLTSIEKSMDERKGH